MTIYKITADEQCWIDMFNGYYDTWYKIGDEIEGADVKNILTKIQAFNSKFLIGPEIKFKEIIK